MKKTCLLIIIMLLAFHSGFYVVNADNALLDSNSCPFCSEDPSDSKTDFMKEYEETIGKSGIKLWSWGYGEFGNHAIEEDYYNCKYIDGSYESKNWKVELRFPDTFDEREYTYLGYNFLNEDAETRINALIPCLPPGLNMLVMALFPDLLRFNQKIEGPHQTHSVITLFQGWVTKGMTYEGEVREPIDINGNIYPYYEIRGRCSYTPFVQEGDLPTFLELLLNFLLLKNDPDFIPWGCCSWEE